VASGNRGGAAGYNQVACRAFRADLNRTRNVIALRLTLVGEVSTDTIESRASSGSERSEHDWSQVVQRVGSMRGAVSTIGRGVAIRVVGRARGEHLLLQRLLRLYRVHVIRE
jgi:hypothetical protein